MNNQEEITGICKKCGKEWKYVPNKSIAWTCSECVKEIHQVKDVIKEK